MNRSNQISFWLAIMIVSPVCSLGDVQSLIQRLGSESFQLRIQAERDLLELGIESFDAIRDATESENPEIRSRSLRVLDLIRQAAIEDSFEQILENPWTVHEALAPGWETYFSLLGDGESAKRLYVDLLKNEPSTMLIVEQSDWQSEFERLCSEVNTFSGFRYRADKSAESMIALLLLGCHPDNEPSGQATSVIYYFLNDSKIRSAVQDPVTGSVVKSLISQWVLKSDAASASQRLSIAASFELPEGLDAARDLIRTRRQHNQTVHLKNAIFYLAKFGGASAIEELENLLDDDTQVQGGFRGQPEIQVRDLALVSLLHLTDQDPASYGLNESSTQTGRSYHVGAARFESEEARQQALNRWHQWQALHRKDTMPDQLEAVEGVGL